MNQDPISLETPVGSEEDSELGDFVMDDKILSPYEQANRNLLKEQLSEVIRFMLDEGLLSSENGLLTEKTS